MAHGSTEADQGVPLLPYNTPLQRTLGFASRCSRANPLYRQIVKLESARKFALSLPETTEEPHFEMKSWRVRGKIFATVSPIGDHLHIFVDEAEVRASVAEDPRTFEQLWWGKKLVGVRVSLPHAGKREVLELLEDAWRRKAPKRLQSLRDTEL